MGEKSLVVCLLFWYPLNLSFAEHYTVLQRFGRTCPYHDDGEFVRLSYLRQGEGYVFIVVRCPVCLFVCLLATLLKNERIFMKFSGLMGLDTRKNWEHFQDIPINPLNIWLFMPLLRRNPRLLAALRKKRLSGFLWNFQKRTDLTQGAIGNIFGMLLLTPWILERFIYFLDPCLFVILWKNGWTDFHDFCMKCQARH